MTGCRYEYAGHVEAIEPLIAEQPDSALAELNRIPSEKLTERDRAIYNVLLTQAIDKTSEDYLTDDSIVAEALNYFETHGDDPHYEMLANYYVGQIALTNKDYGKAICHLQQCEELAESLEDHLNLALACRTLSDLYRLTYMGPDAIEYSKRALEEFIKADDLGKKYVEWAHTDIADSYLAAGKYDTCIIIANDMIEKARSLEDLLLLRNALCSKAIAYSQLNEPDSCIVALKKILAFTDEMNLNNDELRVLAMTYARLQNQNLSRHYAKLLENRSVPFKFDYINLQ